MSVDETSRGGITVTPGLMNVLARHGRMSRHACEGCGLGFPTYAGRYPSACPKCGGRVARKEDIGPASEPINEASTVAVTVATLVAAIEHFIPDMDMSRAPPAFSGLSMLNTLLRRNPAPGALALYAEPLIRWSLEHGNDAIKLAARDAQMELARNLTERMGTARLASRLSDLFPSIPLIQLVPWVDDVENDRPTDAPATLIAAVKRELALGEGIDARDIRTVCAICGVSMSGDPSAKYISHGYCKPCGDAELAKYRAMKAAALVEAQGWDKRALDREFGGKRAPFRLLGPLEDVDGRKCPSYAVVSTFGYAEPPEPGYDMSDDHDDIEAAVGVALNGLVCSAVGQDWAVVHILYRRRDDNFESVPVVAVSRVPRLQALIEAGQDATPSAPGSTSSRARVLPFAAVERVVEGGVGNLKLFLEGPAPAGGHLYFRLEGAQEPVLVFEFDAQAAQLSIFATETPATVLGFDPRADLITEAQSSRGRRAWREALEAFVRRFTSTVDHGELDAIIDRAWAKLPTFGTEYQVLRAAAEEWVGAHPLPDAVRAFRRQDLGDGSGPAPPVLYEIYGGGLWANPPESKPAGVCKYKSCDGRVVTLRGKHVCAGCGHQSPVCPSCGKCQWCSSREGTYPAHEQVAVLTEGMAELEGLVAKLKATRGARISDVEITDLGGSAEVVIALPKGAAFAVAWAAVGMFQRDLTLTFPRIGLAKPERKPSGELVFKVPLTEQVVEPDDHLGIPRKQMPQIDSDQVDAFIDWLRERGIAVIPSPATARLLLPTQSELDTAKVDGFKKADREVLTTRIVTSNDDRILDGHHRWAALIDVDPDAHVETLQVQLPMEELLVLAREFEGARFRKAEESQMVEGFEPTPSQTRAALRGIATAPPPVDFQAVVRYGFKDPAYASVASLVLARLQDKGLVDYNRITGYRLYPQGEELLRSLGEGELGEDGFGPGNNEDTTGPGGKIYGAAGATLPTAGRGATRAVGGFRFELGQARKTRVRRDVARSIQNRMNAKRGLASRISAAKKWHQSAQGRAYHRDLGRYNKKEGVAEGLEHPPELRALLRADVGRGDAETSEVLGRLLAKWDRGLWTPADSERAKALAGPAYWPLRGPSGYPQEGVEKIYTRIRVGDQFVGSPTDKLTSNPNLAATFNEPGEADKVAASLQARFPGAKAEPFLYKSFMGEGALADRNEELHAQGTALNAVKGSGWRGALGAIEARLRTVADGAREEIRRDYGGRPDAETAKFFADMVAKKRVMLARAIQIILTNDWTPRAREQLPAHESIGVASQAKRIAALEKLHEMLSEDWSYDSPNKTVDDLFDAIVQKLITIESVDVLQDVNFTDEGSIYLYFDPSLQEREIHEILMAVVQAEGASAAKVVAMPKEDIEDQRLNLGITPRDEEPADWWVIYIPSVQGDSEGPDPELFGASVPYEGAPAPVATMAVMGGDPIDNIAKSIDVPKLLQLAEHQHSGTCCGKAEGLGPTPDGPVMLFWAAREDRTPKFRGLASGGAGQELPSLREAAARSEGTLFVVRAKSADEARATIRTGRLTPAGPGCLTNLNDPLAVAKGR